MVESFLVRRLFAGVSTRPLSRLLMRRPYQAPVGMGFVAGICSAMSEAGRRWPSDAEFTEGILRHRLFAESTPAQLRLILETLERGYGHKESVHDLSALTVEHIMPQTLTPIWEQALGPDAREVHGKLLHVLGNLTFSGYNSELSNIPFAIKRVQLAKRHLEMNLEIGPEQHWTAAEITTRGKRLAGRAIKIWPGPLATATVPPPQPSYAPAADRDQILTSERLGQVWASAKPGMRAILRRLAETPGQWVPIQDIAAVIGLTATSANAGGVFVGFTRHIRQVYGVDVWPFQARWNDQLRHAEYCMSATIAARICAPNSP